jgi:hypothetical protein
LSSIIQQQAQGSMINWLKGSQNKYELDFPGSIICVHIS